MSYQEHDGPIQPQLPNVPLTPVFLAAAWWYSPSIIPNLAQAYNSGGQGNQLRFPGVQPAVHPLVLIFKLLHLWLGPHKFHAQTIIPYLIPILNAQAQQLHLERVATDLLVAGQLCIHLCYYHCVVQLIELHVQELLCDDVFALSVLEMVYLRG